VGSTRNVKTRHQAGTKRIVALAQEAMRNSGDLVALQETARKVASASFIQEDAIRGLLVKAWGDAVHSVLEDSLLSSDEEAALDRAQQHFGWKQEDVDQNGAFTRLAKGGALRDVLEGKLPARMKVEGQLPFNFQKGEQLVWAFQGVKYYEVRTRRSYVGGYQGASVRIARGVYYRLGGFRGSPVESAETVHADTGILGVTDKHLYFTGPAKSFRVRYQKVVSFTPYSDGIGLQRDAATAKPQAFLTGDGWFTYNLVMNLASLQAGRTPVAAREDTVEPATPEHTEDTFDLPVVGESHYQEALESICGKRNDDGEDRIVDASLILEDSNPHDSHAVRVDIQGKTVGYLSQEDARRFRESVAQTGGTGGIVTCKARIRGGWDRGPDDRGHYGVSLNLTL